MHKAILYTYFGPALCHCTAVGTKTSSSSVLCLGNSDEKEKKFAVVLVKYSVWRTWFIYSVGESALLE